MERKIRINKRGVFVICIMMALIAMPIAATMQAYALQPVTLTIIGDMGTITKNEANILAMPSTTGQGATRGSSGSISNVGTYQGVSVMYLCNLVGGIGPNYTIRTIDVTGNYIVDFTYAQVHDGTGFTTYNPTTGAEQAPTQPLTLILAYSVNGSELSSSSGPLRAVIVGSEGLATSSQLWNKQVATVQLIPDIPEYTLFAWIACLAGFTIIFVYLKGRSVWNKSANIGVKISHN